MYDCVVVVEVDVAGDFECRSCLEGGEGDLEIKKGFGVKNDKFAGAAIFVWVFEVEDDCDDVNRDFIFTLMGDVNDEGDDDGGGGGGGVKNKGSVDKLLKFKLSLLGGSRDDGEENGVKPIVLPTLVGSVDIFELVPVVVVVKVFPHIEDNTKAAATVCSWL